MISYDKIVDVKIGLPPVGSRVELTAPMEGDPCPIMVGERGTVWHSSEHQIGVKWDSGRSLSLIPSADEWRVVLDEDRTGLL